MRRLVAVVAVTLATAFLTFGLAGYLLGLFGEVGMGGEADTNGVPAEGGDIDFTTPRVRSGVCALEPDVCGVVEEVGQYLLEKYVVPPITSGLERLGDALVSDATDYDFLPDQHLSYDNSGDPSGAFIDEQAHINLNAFPPPGCDDRLHPTQPCNN